MPIPKMNPAPPTYPGNSVWGKYGTQIFDPALRGAGITRADERLRLRSGRGCSHEPAGAISRVVGEDRGLFWSCRQLRPTALVRDRRAQLPMFQWRMRR